MARNEALLQITKDLLARRADLRKRLGMELANLAGHSPSGDAADIAFDASGDEMASQLAQVEARELAQVEAAIARIKQGKYGSCVGCGQRIAAARLSALPYSTLCIKCQREVELDSSWLESRSPIDWGNLREEPAERDIDIAQLESELSR